MSGSTATSRRSASGRRSRPRCRGAPTAPGRAGPRRRARASRPTRSSSVNGTSATPSASHVRRTRGDGREHLEPRAQRAGLDAAHREQLADHARQPVGLLGDDLRGGGPGARPRAAARSRGCSRAASGGCARRRAGSRPWPRRGSTSRRFWVLDPGVELGVADRRPRPRSRTARAGPGRRAPSAASRAGGRRRPRSTRPRRRARRPDRDRVAGHELLGAGSRAGRPGAPRSRSSRTRSGASAPCGGRWPRARSSRRDGLERVEEPAQLAVAAREVAGEPVLALGETADLVVARELEARVTGRPPRRGRRTGSSRAQRRADVRRRAPRPASTANTTATAIASSRHPGDGVGRRRREPGQEQHDDAEHRDRHGRRRRSGPG